MSGDGSDELVLTPPTPLPAPMTLLAPSAAAPLEVAPLEAAPRVEATSREPSSNLAGGVDNGQASLGPATAPLRSALARRPSALLGSDDLAAQASRKSRRVSLSTEEPSRVFYEPCQERPVDNYHATLEQLQHIRRQRSMECRSHLSFAQLVSELDAQQGGEALACLVPRVVDAPLGAWQSQRGLTWGQIRTREQEELAVGVA